MKVWSRLVLGIALLFALSLSVTTPWPFLFSTLLLFFLSALAHDDEIPPDELFRRCGRVPPEEKMWRELFRRYRDDINKAIGKVLGFSGWQHQRLFAEVQQEFNLRLLAHEGRALLAFRGQTEPEARGYLYRIATSTAITIAMRDKRKRLPSSDDPPNVHNAKIVKPDIEQGTRLDFEKCLQETQRGRNKARNILMFKLFALENLRPAEIAQIMGINMTAHAVEIQISRARGKLRKCFGAK